MDDLFDIEYWLPFNGGQYHCTIAVGVTQEYVDKVKVQYEIDLKAWRVAPSAWSLPFFHSLNIVKHKFMPKNSSFQKSENHNRLIIEATKKGREEGKRDAMRSAKHYITNRKLLVEFEKNLKS